MSSFIFVLCPVYFTWLISVYNYNVIMNKPNNLAVQFFFYKDHNFYQYIDLQTFTVIALNTLYMNIYKIHFRTLAFYVPVKFTPFMVFTT